MATTIVLRRRIKSAQNINKTTRAMQMIATSKLKKAQDAAMAARPYVDKLSQVTRSLTQQKDGSPLPRYMAETRNSGRTLYVVISPDKGLCGSLVTNLAREVIKNTSLSDLFITIGKKAEGLVSHSGRSLIASFPFGHTLPVFDIVYPLSRIIDENYLEGKVDRVVILTTKLESVFVQKPTFVPFLPVTSLPSSDTVGKANPFILFEPDLESILPSLIKQYLEMVLYQQIIESYLSEQSSRMVAMQNATDNSKDIISDLQLEYNKSRQAKITSELLDTRMAVQ
jgi:F-type H+-transporting ATPase subunit gamma